MISAALYSSESCEWSTPQPLFDRLNAKYGPFDLDVCATAENTKCPYWYALPKIDGLAEPWVGSIWCNPPYGREIGKWVEKAHVESNRLASVVCMLLPARTDTKWFQDFVLPYAEVEFIRGRVKFGGSLNSAPFPSCVVIFRRGVRKLSPEMNAIGSSIMNRRTL